MFSNAFFLSPIYLSTFLWTLSLITTSSLVAHKALSDHADHSGCNEKQGIGSGVFAWTWIRFSNFSGSGFSPRIPEEKRNAERANHLLEENLKFSRQKCLDPDPDLVLKKSWIWIRFVLRGWIRIRFVLGGWIRSISVRIRNPDWKYTQNCRFLL